MSWTEDDIKAALKGVQDPDLKRDLVELGMVREIKVDGENVSLTVQLTTPACPLKDQIGGDVKAALPGGLSFVDARDVAAALPALLEHGEAGVGYLFSALNCTVREFLVLLEQASGVKAPGFVLPRKLIDRAEGVMKWASGLKAFGGLDPQTFEMGCHYWYLDASRAQRDLGFAPRPASETLKDTVEFLRGR